MLACMNDLKKKSARFHWTDYHDTQFQTLKQALVADPIMRHPDFSQKFILLCDASNVTIRGVQAQENEEEPGLLHPIFFGSKALSEAERKISTYEKEFLAIYLIKFNEDASAKVVRWKASLIAYDFDIIYKTGKLYVHMDAMSKLQTELTPEQEAGAVMADYYLPLNVIWREPDDGFTEGQITIKKKRTSLEELVDKQIVRSAGMKEVVYATLIKYLTKWKYPEHYTLKRRKALRHLAQGFPVVDGTLYKKPTKECPEKRQVIRQAEVVKELRENHGHILAGHLGISATYQRIKTKYYWPGYYDTVWEYVLCAKK